MNEIQSLVEAERGNASVWKICFDVRELVKTRARRYRLYIAMSAGWGGQFSGSNIASYYLPQMAENVGITSTSSLLLLNSLYSVICWIAAGSGAILHDYIGRRKMLGGSMLSMSICFAVMAGTTYNYNITGSQESSKALIAFVFLFGISFSFAWTSMQPIYPAEVLDNRMRARGMALFQINSGVAAFINTFAGSIAIANIGYWFFVFYCFLDFLQFVLIMIFYVETKGRTLEELDLVFESPNPRKASTQLRKVNRGD